MVSINTLVQYLLVVTVIEAVKGCHLRIAKRRPTSSAINVITVTCDLPIAIAIGAEVFRVESAKMVVSS